MVWNAAGTFHTRLSATALTANRKFVFPDQDGTFVVASASHLESINRLTIRQDVLTGSVGFALAKFGIANGAEAGWTLNPAASDLVVIYAYGASTVGRSRLWAINPIVDVSAMATVWGGEINVNMGWGNAPDPHTTNHAIGLDMVSGGTFAPSVAIATNATSAANRWKHGIWFDFIGGQIGSTLIKAASNISADYGIDLSSATFRLQHVRLGPTQASLTAVLALNQATNGNIGLFVQRFTDVAPTGNLIQVTNAANSTILLAVDASGNLTGQLGTFTALSTGSLATDTLISTGTLNISATAGTVNLGVEVFPGRAINGATYIDFHATSATDFDLRIIRWGGISGTAELVQSGGGPLKLDASVVDITTLLRIGGAATIAPYNTTGSIVSTAGAAAAFKNTPKVMVSFRGSAAGVTIDHSFNISAVTRTAAGTYTVNFSNDISARAAIVTGIDTGGLGFVLASGVDLGSNSSRSCTAISVLNGAIADAPIFLQILAGP